MLERGLGDACVVQLGGWRLEAGGVVMALSAMPTTIR
jgi:hypothetical protein